MISVKIGLLHEIVNCFDVIPLKNFGHLMLRRQLVLMMMIYQIEMYSMIDIICYYIDFHISFDRKIS